MLLISKIAIQCITRTLQTRPQTRDKRRARPDDSTGLAEPPFRYSFQSNVPGHWLQTKNEGASTEVPYQVHEDYGLRRLRDEEEVDKRCR